MAVFFDLDGTLVDTCQDIVLAINNLCRELNKPLADQKLLRDNISFGVEKILPIALNVKITDLTPQELVALKNRFKSLYQQSKFQESKLFPGLKELIIYLKQRNIKIAVVTNKLSEFAIPILQQVNLMDQIDCLATADMVVYPKPAPDLLFFAIDKLQVDPKKCIFIGDAEQDIIAGKSAGITTIAALFGYVGNVKNALNWPADYFVEDSNDLMQLINKIY